MRIIENNGQTTVLLSFSQGLNARITHSQSPGLPNYCMGEDSQFCFPGTIFGRQRDVLRVIRLVCPKCPVFALKRCPKGIRTQAGADLTANPRRGLI
jgi:hypothetical protein